ncbi:MAG: hypothetical protein KGL39_04740 [Patescibacteria group bacterium]|nr:hypothetical protein [Patescibacteria group bacterium]
MTTQPAKKPRVEKKQSLDARFNGIIRTELTFTSEGFDTANAALDRIEKAIRAALPAGCEVTFSSRGPGKMIA